MARFSGLPSLRLMQAASTLPQRTGSNVRQQPQNDPIRASETRVLDVRGQVLYDPRIEFCLSGIRPKREVAMEEIGSKDRRRARRSVAYRFRRSLGWRGLRGTVRQGMADATALLDLPTLLLSYRRPGPANERELRVFAPRRSGHHAFLQWVEKNSSNRVVFLNDCTPDASPFLTCRGPHIYDQGISHRYLNRRREANGKRSKKGTLIYNYENLELSEDVIRHLDVHRERWVGQSRWRADVLILRDPFNLLASVLRSRRQGNPVAGAPALERARRIWKSYAREFVGRSSFFRSPTLVSYNEWFVSEDTRRALANTLGLSSADKGLEKVAEWGPAAWGASFDGLSKDGRASQMGVLERWSQYVDDPVYVAQFQDDELWDLSGSIFGEIPGTQVLRKPVVAGQVRNK